MSGFKEPNFADRQKAAMQARQDILNKFRAQPGPDDPEVKRRQAEAPAVEAARLAQETEEEIARLAALALEQKAKRDARYAARKGKGKKK